MSYQQINLYQKHARRSGGGISFSLPVVAVGTVALVALLVALGLSQQSANRSLAGQLDNINTQLNQLDIQSQALQETLASGNTGNLEQRQQRLQQQLVRLQQVRNLMARQQATTQSSFAEQLTGLSQHHLKGISLQQIDLLKGGRYLSLSGDAHPAQVVPQYLQKLQGDQRFQHARFGPLQMERNERRQGPIRFRLGEPQEPQP